MHEFISKWMRWDLQHSNARRIYSDEFNIRRKQTH